MDDTDKKLLEQAAAAAGDPVEGWTADAGFVPVAILRSGARWQPLLVNRLTDCMGDALRLAVKLGFTVRVYKDRMEPFTRVEAHVTGSPRNADHCICEEEHRDDADRATRRAIVRAAAAIGANDVAHA